MSVMVPFSSDSISSTGPGMGSCWHKCSARRICCRFCQMISASFSHLGEGGSEAQHPPCGASAPPPASPPPRRTHQVCNTSRVPSGGPPFPASCCRRFHWISSSSRMVVCCLRSSCSVFWCFSASSCEAARCHGARGQRHSRHGDAPPALTTRYCCSVWASRCSQASSDAFFCCSVVSRDRRSWGPSWESWENWAGGRGAASGPAPPAPGSPPSPPRPQIHLGGACSPGTG